MSATSQRNEETPAAAQAPGPPTTDGPEAQLLQYHQASQPPTTLQQAIHATGFGDIPQPQQQAIHQHTQSASFPMQSMSFSQDAQYMQQDPAYTNHVRMGSAPVHSGAEMGDDKRRKASAVTATNDRELREMLGKNEGRPLREVALEVIQKERTPMAEKTKQLFAMLWYGHHFVPLQGYC
jgi:regulatory factor X, other